MIPLFKVFVSDESKDLTNRTLHSGFIGEGPMVKEFEQALSTILKSHNVLALNSASSGLELAVHMAKKVNNGTKVLTTALSCIATNWPILHHGLRPEWVDVNPTTLNMNLDDLWRKLNDDVAIIIVTHWGGRAHYMDDILEMQGEHFRKNGRSVPIIEDCAHAWGGSYGGQMLGTFGDFGVYSFQAIKPLTCGDGGLIISKNKCDHEQIKKLRWYGIDRDARDLPIYEAGYKYHMNDIAASIGLGNVAESCRNVKKSMENARFYNDNLIGIDAFSPLDRPDHHIEHPYWIYTALVDRREDFMKVMKDRGVETSPVHTRNDTHPCVAGYHRQLPALDSVADKVVNIPVGWWVSEDNRNHICKSIQKGW